MKALRLLCIALLVTGLLGVNAADILAKGPQEGKGSVEDKSLGDKDFGKNLKGKKKGFTGNVTEVTVVDDEGIIGNISLITNQGWTTVISVANSTIYKVPGKSKGWEGNFTEFIGNIGEDLTSLEGKKVSLLAGNITGNATSQFGGVALKLMVLPEPEPGPPLHAHRTGNVTEFNIPDGDGIGNITIIDVHGVSHLFEVGNNTEYQTEYHPEGTTPSQIETESFVTIVTKGNPKLFLIAKAKAIVLHTPET